jgi:hypothetical protein
VGLFGLRVDLIEMIPMTFFLYFLNLDTLLSGGQFEWTTLSSNYCMFDL